VQDSQQSLQDSTSSPTGSPSRAYLDTTVVANALLRSDATGKRCAEAIERYAYSEMPEYALKELKAGPLSAWVWAHNKFNETRSFADTLAAIGVISSTPRRNFSASALQALQQAAEADKASFVTDLGLPGDGGAPIDRALADRYRLYLRRKVISAWRRRRTVVSHVSLPLLCFIEGDLLEKSGGNLAFERYSCPRNADCDVFKVLSRMRDDVYRLMEVVKAQPQKPENTKRYQALRHIHRTPNRAYSDSLCRGLGDAVFSLMAPRDCVILTTNIKDHGPLAKAVGKVAVEP
jgi:hypothetical protein